jgi:hypothetical protein
VICSLVSLLIRDRTSDAVAASGWSRFLSSRKIALECSTRVFHLYVSRSRGCMRVQDASTMALSNVSPTVPSE